MTFKINKYQIIKKAVSYELANFIYNYFMLKRDAVKWMYENNIIYDNSMLGTWTDKQIPNTYAHYADMVMETLMMKVLPVMQQETGLNLIPSELTNWCIAVVLPVKVMSPNCAQPPTFSGEPYLNLT